MQKGFQDLEKENFLKKKNRRRSSHCNSFFSNSLIKSKWLREMGINSHHAGAMPGHSCERGQTLPHVARQKLANFHQNFGNFSSLTKSLMTLFFKVFELLENINIESWNKWLALFYFFGTGTKWRQWWHFSHYHYNHHHCSSCGCVGVCKHFLGTIKASCCYYFYSAGRLFTTLLSPSYYWKI